MSIKLYVFVLDTLGDVGLFSAQASHGVQQVVRKYEREYADACHSYTGQQPSDACLAYMKWDKEPIVVNLIASSKQLTQLAIHQDTEVVWDTIKSINDEILTCVVFPPHLYEIIKPIARNYKLLNNTNLLKK
jgi:hypothetical protein